MAGILLELEVVTGSSNTLKSLDWLQFQVECLTS